MQILYVIAYVAALYLLTLDVTVYDIVLWWAVLTFPSRRNIPHGQWPLALGVAISSLNPVAKVSTVFSSAIFAAYVAYYSAGDNGDV